jgi:hypothetical protein
MIRFRTLLCAAVAACGFTLGFTAQAQTTITSITLPSAGCVVSGSTLDCSGGSVSQGSCSLTSNTGSFSALTGASITLTGACTTPTGADTFTWSGSNECASTGPTCTLTQTATVKITGSGGEKTSQLVSFTSGSCTFSPNNPTITSGGSQTFTVSGCTFNPASYTWTGCSSNTASCTLSNVTSGGSISVTAVNGSANWTGSTNYSVSSGIPVGVPATCPNPSGGNLTTVVTPVFTGATGNSPTYKISNTQILVVPMQLPAGKWQFSAGDSSTGSKRNAFVSQNPCFITTSPTWTPAKGNYASVQWANNTNTPTLSSWSANGVAPLGMNITKSLVSTNFSMSTVPGDTWYLIFRNVDCANGASCPLTINVAPGT